MPFVDTGKLEVIEKGLGGWRGRQFHSSSMTFCHWEFDNGASVHEHAHAQEEVWEIWASKHEVTIDGVTQIGVPGSEGTQCRQGDRRRLSATPQSLIADRSATRQSLQRQQESSISARREAS